MEQHSKLAIDNSTDIYPIKTESSVLELSWRELSTSIAQPAGHEKHVVDINHVKKEAAVAIQSCSINKQTPD